MRTVTIGGKKYRVPAIEHVSNTGDDPLWFTIAEGRYKGIDFSISNIHIAEEESDLLRFDLDLSEPDKIKPVSKIVGNFLIVALYDMIRREETKQNSDTLENQGVTSALV